MLCYHELKRDFDALRIDYGDLMSAQQQTNDNNNENNHMENEKSSSEMVGESETLVAESSEMEMENWMVAQKNAIVRIDQLQEQINDYRNNLLKNNNNPNQEDQCNSFELKLDLDQLKQ